MAKASEKKTTTPAKAPAVKKASTTKATSEKVSIEQACITALEKLKALNLDDQLQADIQWCLGSYSNDKNPIGLYEMGERALELFKAESAKKTKGITAKFITDLEKVVKSK